MNLSKSNHANKQVLHVPTTKALPYTNTYMYMNTVIKVPVHLKSEKKTTIALKYTYKCFGFCKAKKGKKGPLWGVVEKSKSII